MGPRRLKGKERRLFREKKKPLGMLLVLMYTQQSGRGKMPLQLPRLTSGIKTHTKHHPVVLFSLDCAVQTRHFYGAEFLSPDLWVTGASIGRKDTCSGEKKHTWDAFSFDYAAERKGQNASAAAPD